MAHAAWLNKYLAIKPEVKQIYDDLDAWLNYCRFHMIKYDESDLYRSPVYKEWQEKRKRRDQWRQRQGSSYQGNNRR